MKNLNKRLPVLILAFLIALMPLSMAVPANADNGVLVGGAPSSALFSYRDVTLPYFDLADSFDRYVIYYYADLYYIFLPIPNDASISKFDLSGNGQFRLYFSSSVDLVTYKFVDGSWSNSSDQGSVDSFFINSSSPGFYGISESLFTPSAISFYSPISVIPPASGGPGILSVFSGVSSWLAGAVNNMIPMFWTAEAGLTPIGVLTVCSLALAVILLLFWLIAGWLKFK